MNKFEHVWGGGSPCGYQLGFMGAGGGGRCSLRSEIVVLHLHTDRYD